MFLLLPIETSDFPLNDSIVDRLVLGKRGAGRLHLPGPRFLFYWLAQAGEYEAIQERCVGRVALDKICAQFFFMIE